MLFQNHFQAMPMIIKLVSWGFKEKRFIEHFRALSLPNINFQFIGVGTPSNLAQAEIAEQKTLAQFIQNPLGLSKGLLKKRELRNPRGSRIPYPEKPPWL